MTRSKKISARNAGKPGKQHAGKSNPWTVRQNRDPFVLAARKNGLRARAVFKLEEIDRKYALIKPDSLIVDLGAAPGSWCQYAANRVRGDGQIIAVDLLAMKAVDKVAFIRGDFTQSSVVAQIMGMLDARQPDLVLSDLAPNISGIADTDQARMAELQDSVIQFCRQALRQRGTLLTKLFAGNTAAASRKQIGDCFAQVQTIKPEASRSQSKEMYLLARGYAGDMAGDGEKVCEKVCTVT